MANKYCNLPGADKISETFGQINDGFDLVEADVTAVNGRINTVEADMNVINGRINTVEADINARVDNIITTPIEGTVAAQEVVDARGSFVSLGARLTDVDSQLAENAQDIRTVQSNPFTRNNAVVCFIDDDGGRYIRDIWVPIIQEKNFKMGFGIITGYIGGLQTPPDIYLPLPIEEMKALYNDGHDVYSHSYTHPAFYDETNVSDNYIDEQCRISQEWMLNNGFERNSDIIVYPGGINVKNVSRKSVIKKYYKYGIDSRGDAPNPNPLDNMAVMRANADELTLEQLKTRVDSAKETGSMLVLMNHAYEMNKDKTNQMQKIKDLIDYIRSIGVEIKPFSEAIKTHGNVISIGEYTQDNSLFVGVDGRFKGGNVVFKEQTNMNELLSSYKEDTITVSNLSYLNDTFLNVGGTKITYCFKNKSFSYELYIPINSNDLYMRKWDITFNQWKGWEKISRFTNMLKGTANVMDKPITDYPKSSITYVQVDYVRDTYLSKGGNMVVVRGDNDAYAYAEFVTFAISGMVEKHVRRWNDTNKAWGTWNKV